MDKENPVEFSGKFLDKRNDLTGPDKGKGTYPELRQHIPIEEPDTKNT